MRATPRTQAENTRKTVPRRRFARILALVSTGYTDAGLVNGTTYYYAVSAVNGAGEGANSSQAFAMPAPLLLTGFSVAGANLVLNGWGGVVGRSFYPLGSTNLAVPAPQWTRLATNSFGPSGSISVTNAFDPNLPQPFYLIQIAFP